MMKIVVLDGYTTNPGDLTWEGLEKLGTTTVYDRTSEDEILDRIKDAEVVFTSSVPLSKDTIENAKNLKFIGVLATGYNDIDIDTARKLGIPVTNIPTYGTDSVAQMAFAHLLEICNNVGVHDKTVKNNEWTNNADWCFWKEPLIELAGKTMGIIGYGRIGQTSGKIAQAFGMNVLAYANHPKKELECESMKYVELDDLLAKSDVINLHCPLVEDTKGIINKDTIAKMKNGVIIINTSRGQLIVEEDLAQALNRGKVYAAGLDVVATEPILEDNPLLKARNVFLTPHIAWAPKESRARLIDIAVDNLKQFMDANPINVVNR